MHKLFTLAILSAALLWPQEAKVVILSSVDATKAKQIYEAMRDATAAWKALQQDLHDRYLTVESPASGWLTLGPCTTEHKPAAEPKTYRATMPGFEQGFELDPTFHVIVPKSTASQTLTVPYWPQCCNVPYYPTPSTYYWPQCGMGCVTPNPVTCGSVFCATSTTPMTGTTLSLTSPTQAATSGTANFSTAYGQVN